MSTPRSLKARALQWLAQREQSRSELRRKLLRAAAMGERATAQASPSRGSALDDASEAASAVDIAAQSVEALLDWLEAHDFLSSERFAESRAHARSARFGNLRIRQELKQHQVALPTELARSLNDSERRRALDVRGRRFAAWPANAAERARQARFLAGRGFSPDAIGHALRGADRDDGSTEL